MRIIKCLTEQIRDEVEDAEKYIDLAIEWREKEPETADLFAELSEEELGHMHKLHKQVESLINDYKAKNGEPSPGMMVLYEFMHDMSLENMMRVKVKQAMFKE